MKARIRIMPRRGVLDPQGQAIANALKAMGFEGIGDVRQGKLIEVEIAATNAGEARDRLDAMCARLLANPVIEDYEIDLSPADGDS
ncbi:MAG: phosphoribosylformylglycinamidine synthase subunit PurS [Alphaproteobacteria bacterium]